MCWALFFDSQHKHRTYYTLFFRQGHGLGFPNLTAGRPNRGSPDLSTFAFSLSDAHQSDLESSPSPQASESLEQW